MQAATLTKLTLTLTIAVMTAWLGLASQVAHAETTKTTPVAATPATPEKRTAEQIVTGVCAACHGTDGNSVVTLNPKLAAQHPEYIMGGMAAGLSDEDMKNVAAYFSSQKLTLGAAKTNGKGSLGEKIYRGGIASTNVPACAACHGPTGAGLPKQFPRLQGQHADYTLAQLKTFRTGERANAPMMMAIATKLTDAEMAAVADYIQGLR